MIKFGPSGNSDLFYDQGFKSSLDAPRWLKNRDLDAYEYSFSRGFTISEFVAKTLGEKCKENNIALSVHAPYYINLANPDDEFVEKSLIETVETQIDETLNISSTSVPIILLNGIVLS